MWSLHTEHGSLAFTVHSVLTVLLEQKVNGLRAGMQLHLLFGK